MTKFCLVCVGGGTRTVTQKTTETTTKGFGGTAYGKPAGRDVKFKLEAITCLEVSC